MTKYEKLIMKALLEMNQYGRMSPQTVDDIEKALEV